MGMLVPPTGRVAAQGIRDAGTLILARPVARPRPASLQASWQLNDWIAADHTAVSRKGR